MDKFNKINTKEAVNKLIKDKQVITVTGAFFGDEAKGKTVASIANHKDVSLIARVNSGENAGHTVYYNKEKFVFHLLPSGIFSGKKIIVGDNCVMDPLSFYYKEISPLLKRGVSTENISIGNTSIVFPWHKIADALRDPNASTGKGMSQIHSDISRKKDVSLETIINQRYDNLIPSLTDWWKEIEPKLNDEIIAKLIANNKIPIDIEKFLTAKNHQERIDILIESYQGEVKDFLTEHYANTTKLMIDELVKGKKIILEGPQSFYLSNAVDTHHKSSTSANTHTTGIYAASNLPPKYTNSAITINVHKAPGPSRVGSGANPSGHINQDWFSKRGLTKDNLPQNIEINSALRQFVETIDKETGLQDSSIYYKNNNGETLTLNNISEKYKKPLTVNEALAISEAVKFGEFGSTTKKPRITGALDLPHLKNLKTFQQGKLSISCLDRGDGLEYILLVKGYQYLGEEYNYKGTIYKTNQQITLDEQLPGEEVLKQCIPIYEVMDGWIQAESLETNIQNYLGRIEELTGMNIISIGVGPETEQIIYLDR